MSGPSPAGSRRTASRPPLSTTASHRPPPPGAPARQASSVGTLRHDVDPVSEYQRLAEEDEQAGLRLQLAGLFRHAIYFFLQAMEKQVRAKIFSIVLAGNPYFRENNRSHSVDLALEFLVEVVSIDPTVRERIRAILDTYVVGGIRFSQLYNNVRYPFFSERYGTFSALDVEATDAELIRQRLTYLKTMLQEIERIR